jgi:hypothetical protein
MLYNMKTWIGWIFTGTHAVMRIRRITSHPKITPAKLAEVRAARERIDREEKQGILATGRQAFSRHEKIRQTIVHLNALREERHLTL